MNGPHYYFLRYFLPRCKNVWKPLPTSMRAAHPISQKVYWRKSLCKNKTQKSVTEALYELPFFPLQLYKNNTVAKLLYKNPLSSHSCVTGQAFQDRETGGQGITPPTTCEIKRMNQTTTKKSITLIRNRDMDTCCCPDLRQKNC